jgi:glycosyltransferase involved in cell wall biosynthesis
MAQRLKVLLLIPHLGGGGAGQVTSLLARGLSRERYEVHVGVVTHGAAAPQRLPPWVTVHALGASRVRAGAFLLPRLVWRLKPKVILSGMAHLNFLVLLLRPLFPPGTHVLVRQNGTVSAALEFGDLPGYTRLLYRLLYRFADRVVCQTRAMAADLARETGVRRERIEVLPNPVDVDGIRAAMSEGPSEWNGAGPHLLAVGRLAPVKGFDLLLRALALVRERFEDADLVIAGTGEEESALKALAAGLGVRESVHFVGRVDQPSKYFAGATLFALSSRHEGLPNALLEAAAGGLPIVALPASEGVVDLLSGQPGVWLAPTISVEALATSLVAALEGLQSGERFPHPFVEQFSLRHSIQAYGQLIDSVVGARQS